ncbi:MAG: ABC transporter ATP-binding protein, partial [Clostridia bacterium]|nr:ABC transporter ATP-binding protein [Clostridia bacterium]
MAQEKTYTQKPQAMKPMRGRGMPVPKGAIKKGTLSRLLKMVFKYYKWRMIIVFTCLVLSSVGSLVSTIYMKDLVNEVITPAIKGGGMTDALYGTLTNLIIMMVAVYSAVIVATFTQARIMATVTQGMLYHIREEMFTKMQTLPIKYFDTHAHGDIMSTYTNDTDAVRQIIGQSLPNLFSNSMTLIVSVVMMLSFSFWLSLVVAVSTFAMTFVVKKIGGGSAKYMVAQQTSLAVEEGFMEEMMKGQKVVKVFTHEEKAKEDFEKLNDKLFEDSKKAHVFGNILGPILGNIGNFTYVLIAVVGALLFSLKVPNWGFSNLFAAEKLALDLGTIIAFLGFSRNFAQIVNQMSQQISMIAMGLAGASRAFTLMDEPAEHDEGYVTLVYAKKDEDGNLTESEERTGLWAWKHY